MSHAPVEDPYAEAVKVREPVERPLDIVAVELLLSASQAYVAGVLMYLAVGFWSDRGVGVGSVAVILALLSLAVGAAWLFWLLGGTGWPLAAADAPVAMFSVFALVLGITGDGLIALEPLPLLLLIAGSVYGLVGGVFVDSPRRWRWDQRRALRAGTKVPRVSPTTRALAARVPRSLPRRRTGTEPGWPEPPPTGTATGDEAVTASTGMSGTGTGTPGSGTTGPGTSGSSAPEDLKALQTSTSEAGSGGGARAVGDDDDEAVAEGSPAASGAGSVQQTAGPAEPRPDTSDGVVDRAPDGTIELPTSVEPRPQRSPWAWASPPEWNRDDEDDESTSTGPRRP